MVDKPRRPILHLKFSPASSEEAPARPKMAPETPRAAGSTKVFIPPPRPAGPVRPFFAPKPPPRAKRAPPPRADPRWRCKPCGKAFDVGPELADDEYVRCPSCNARLGLAVDFRGDPPNVAKVRARYIEKS